MGWQSSCNAWYPWSRQHKFMSLRLMSSTDWCRVCYSWCIIASIEQFLYWNWIPWKMRKSLSLYEQCSVHRNAKISAPSTLTTGMSVQHSTLAAMLLIFLLNNTIKIFKSEVYDLPGKKNLMGKVVGKAVNLMVFLIPFNSIHSALSQSSETNSV